MAVPLAISGNAGTSKTGVRMRCLFNNAATPLARFAVTVENLKSETVRHDVVLIRLTASSVGKRRGISNSA